MIEKLAKLFVAWQIRQHYLSPDKEKLYQYAFELLIGQAINLMIACLLAVIFHAYVTIFIFLLTFIPLRSYAGGHHADSSNVCMIVSALILLTVCLLSRITFTEKMVLLLGTASAAISGILVFLLAPVEDKNKPLDQLERRYYGKWSRVIWVLETMAWSVCYYIQKRQISVGIILAHLTVAILLCAGVIKRKYLEQKLLNRT